MSTSGGESLAAAYAATLASVAGSLPHLLEPLRSVRAPAVVLDLGTGVGEPALTLATERPDIEVIGVDHEQSYVARATRGGGGFVIPYGCQLITGCRWDCTLRPFVTDVSLSPRRLRADLPPHGRGVRPGRAGS